MDLRVEVSEHFCIHPVVDWWVAHLITIQLFTTPLEGSKSINTFNRKEISCIHV